MIASIQGLRRFTSVLAGLIGLACLGHAGITVTFVGNHFSSGGGWYRPSDSAIAICALSCKKPGSSCTISTSVTNTVGMSIEVGATTGIDWGGVKDELSTTFGVDVGSSVTVGVSTTVGAPLCHSATLYAFPVYECKIYDVTETPLFFGSPKTARIHVSTPTGGIAKIWKSVVYEPDCPGCCPGEGTSCPPPVLDAWHCSSSDISSLMLAEYCTGDCGDETTATCTPYDPTPGTHSNDTPLNNGGDAIYVYSSPSSGFTSGAVPPDVQGDLYWRTHSGAAMMNDFDAVIGAAMEVDGYYEWLFDTDWSTSPSFYVRAHGPALPSLAGDGALQPAFFQLGLTTESVVAIGPSGLGNPCTLVPTLCSPSGGDCPPSGFINGYAVDLRFGDTPGSGIVLPADGTPASDTATVYFVTGGMTAVGGLCGAGDYELQDLHSTDESQADAGFGINPSGGFQTAASGPFAEGVQSMTASTETWRGNVVNVVADSGGGLGVETSANGGGAMNGRQLSVGGGSATIGVELRDLRTAQTLPGLSLGIVGASFGGLPNPGLPALGGTLLILPDTLFAATSGVWQAPIQAGVFAFTTEGVMSGAQLPIPPNGVGATLHVQGAALSLVSVTLDSTNAVTTRLLP